MASSIQNFKLNQPEKKECICLQDQMNRPSTMILVITARRTMPTLRQNGGFGGGAGGRFLADSSFSAKLDKFLKKSFGSCELISLWHQCLSDQSYLN